MAIVLGAAFRDQNRNKVVGKYNQMEHMNGHCILCRKRQIHKRRHTHRERENSAHMREAFGASCDVPPLPAARSASAGLESAAATPLSAEPLGSCFPLRDVSSPLITQKQKPTVSRYHVSFGYFFRYDDKAADGWLFKAPPDHKKKHQKQAAALAVARARNEV